MVQAGGRLHGGGGGAVPLRLAHVAPGRGWVFSAAAWSALWLVGLSCGGWVCVLAARGWAWFARPLALVRPLAAEVGRTRRGSGPLLALVGLGPGFQGFRGLGVWMVFAATLPPAQKKRGRKFSRPCIYAAQPPDEAQRPPFLRFHCNVFTTGMALLCFVFDFLLIALYLAVLMPYKLILAQNKHYKECRIYLNFSISTSFIMLSLYFAAFFCTY